MKVSDELPASARAAGEVALPALVGMRARSAVGSGCVIGEGRVPSSAHNLRPGARSLHFRDGSLAERGAATTDFGSDLAVLAVETGGVAPLAWADERPRLGDLVFAAARSERRAAAQPGHVGGFAPALSRSRRTLDSGWLPAPSIPAPRRLRRPGAEP